MRARRVAIACIALLAATALAGCGGPAGGEVGLEVLEATPDVLADECGLAAADIPEGLVAEAVAVRTVPNEDMAGNRTGGSHATAYLYLVPSEPGKPGLRVRVTPFGWEGDISPRDLLDEQSSAWAAYAGDPAFLRAARGASYVSFMEDGGEMTFLAYSGDVGSLEEAWYAPDGDGGWESRPMLLE